MNAHPQFPASTTSPFTVNHVGRWPHGPRHTRKPSRHRRCRFPGSYAVRALVDRGEKGVVVFDLAEAVGDDKVPNVEYYQGDILDEKRLVEVLQQVLESSASLAYYVWSLDSSLSDAATRVRQTSARTVFHTASPVHGLDSEIYSRVNETGTKVVICACHAAGVRKLVYTSSTGVVWTSRDLRGVNEEQAEVPRRGYDAYHHTKAIGERMILHEDGVGKLRTVALRPCGMIGPGDRQLKKRLARVYADGRHNIQIGDNTNLVGWSYVGNIADAHVLAADRLPSANWDVSKPHPVAGQVFFVTNDVPIKQFDFQRLVFKELGDDGSKKIVVIPRWLGIVMGTISKIWCKFTGTMTGCTFAIKAHQRSQANQRRVSK